jgi:hypothetical protein
MTISIDYDDVQKKYWRTKLFDVSLVSLSIVSTLLPVCMKDYMDKETKLSLLSLGLISSVVNFTKPKNELITKQKKIYEDTELQLFRDKVTGEVKTNISAVEMDNDMRMVQMIEEKVPDYQLSYWADRFGLTPLFSKFYIDKFEEEQYTQPNKLVIPNDLSVEQPHKYGDEPATLDWLYKLVEEYTRENGKRLHEHIHIMGVTQSGKSTLTNLLLELIVFYYHKLNKRVILNLIDPKYPETTWGFEPNYTGFQSVLEGISQAKKEMDKRKKLREEAKKNKKPRPEFDVYIVVFDELDASYGKGKGYAGDISKKDASEIMNMVSAILTTGASYDVRIILIGQSSLSGNNGINTSLARNITRIVLGTEALAFLESPFFPVKSQAASVLKTLNPLVENEVRCGVVTANKGKAYTFEIPEIEKTKEVEKPNKTIDNPIEEIKNWCNSLPEYPNRETIRNRWKELTGESLTDDALNLLIIKLDEP